MKGTVSGPGRKGRVTVLFESPGGLWGVFPHDISREKQIVCLLS